MSRGQAAAREALLLYLSMHGRMFSRERPSCAPTFDGDAESISGQRAAEEGCVCRAHPADLADPIGHPYL